MIVFSMIYNTFGIGYIGRKCFVLVIVVDKERLYGQKKIIVTKGGSKHEKCDLLRMRIIMNVYAIMQVVRDFYERVTGEIQNFSEKSGKSKTGCRKLLNNRLDKYSYSPTWREPRSC